MANRREQIKQWLKNILEENLSGITYRAFIFGSQANKEILGLSDIDVGIIADNSISMKAIISINDAIEDLPMLYKVDMVDFNEVDEKFKAIALRNVEWL